MSPSTEYAFEFEPSIDYDLIRGCFVHPKCYPMLTDDFSPPAAEFQVIEHPALLYIVVRDRAELLGVWMFAPQNAICWEVHTCLLPNAWGPRAIAAAKEMIPWIWQNTRCQRIVTHVPEHNRKALAFALRAGLKKYGVNEHSFQKGGKLYAQIELGITRPE